MTLEHLQSHFDTFLGFRRSNIELINTVETDKIDIIPNQWRNNIRWHSGHLVVVQASLLHVRFDRETPLDTSWVKYFAKGTSPDDFDDNLPGHDKVLKMLKSLPDFTHSQISELCSLKYSEPRTVTGGLVLKSFLDAMAFMPIHEAYHMGAMKAMIKLL